jgi:hypothetical protein
MVTEVTTPAVLEAGCSCPMLAWRDLAGGPFICGRWADTLVA